MQKRKMPRDVNQRAKLIADMVYGEVEPEPKPEKDPERVERGRLGGAKGGAIRAARLTPDERSAIARRAAQARWQRTAEG